MLVPGDLGFRVAALFLFVIFPAISLLLRRKWRIALARSEEINRLLVLASEEAARAELEASIGYSTTSASVVPSQRICAVCYTPTQNRCARCKSVNYCSGKCQIIHWRQGHKDECRPTFASFENDEAINFVGNAVKQPSVDDYIVSIENDGIKCAKQVDTSQKPGFTNHVPSPSELSTKDNNDAAEHSLHGEKLDSVPKIHGIPISSGVHESVSADGLCVDVSISDDDSLHDLNSDSSDSCCTFDNLETGVSNRNVEEAKSLGEESYTRVESDGNIFASGSPKEEALDETTGLSGLSISHADKKSVETSVLTSGFWDGYLDCSRIRNHASSSNVNPNFGRSGDSKFPDPKFSMQFSFNLSDNCSSELHSQTLEASLDPHPGSLRASKLVVEPTLPDKESTDATGRRSSTILTAGRTETRVKENTLKNNGLPFRSLEGASLLDKDTKGTSLSLVSEKAGLSPKIPNGRSSSVTRENTASAVKSEKAGGNGAMAPQVTSSTSGAAVGLKTSVIKVVEQLRAPRLSKQGVGRNYKKGIFPYELFVKLYHWNKLELRPCGLINCGNSCYANAVLQCLAFTPPLTAYLLQGLHSKACVKKEWCFTCEFERLILKGKERGSPLSPIGILSQIEKIGSHLSNGREEDAHEFLRYAIDTMQSICLREARTSTPSSLEEETTLMGLTFGGYLRSKIKCTRCHGKSERQERMMDLTVEIEGDIETLEDALRQFTGTESLDGENKYHCGRCKSYEKAKKKLSILEAPNVLTIALKRFQSGKFGKLNKSIRFPEILNLAPYMRGSSDKSPIYRLYGVVVHLDIMNAAFSGHYVCYVRNAQNKWYKIDDSMVKAVELERVLNKGAYMLFYSRCSPRAPRSIRSSMISGDLSNKMKNPEVDPGWTNGRNTSSRHTDTSVDANHIHDDLANLGYVHRDETRRVPHILEADSSSDSSSLFSHSDEVSSCTDSTRESISADDISDYIFGYNSMWRHSSDSDTSSSSSSSSSSPPYTKRYASTLSQPSFPQTARSAGPVPSGTHRAEELGLGSRVGVSSFLQSNSSKQVRKIVNSSTSSSSSSNRANPLDDVVSGVHLRRSSRKKAD